MQGALAIVGKRFLPFMAVTVYDVLVTLVVIFVSIICQFAFIKFSIRIAIASTNNMVIKPNSVFSFTFLITPPSATKSTKIGAKIAAPCQWFNTHNQ